MSVTLYDTTPYPCHAYPQTHPEHLGAITWLHGVEAAPPEQARILEIGCGDGGNLIPMAYGLPNANFLGTDLATTSIEVGTQRIERLGLRNIQLRAVDIMAMDPAALGQWDYIIAHGVFSWVPEFVRLRLLEVIRGLLSPTGVAFISYNAFPGCHVRFMVREMLKFHLHGAPDEAKVPQGKAFLSFLKEGMPGGDDSYAQMMEAEVDRVMKFHPHHFYHDDLAEINQPYYLHQFATLAQERGLQYLGEADYQSMFDLRVPSDIRQILSQLGDDVIKREQYLDFLKCRRFRQTLLVRDDCGPISRTPLAESLDRLWMTSSATPSHADCNLADDSEVDFKGNESMRLQTSHPVAKTALAILSSHFPQRLSWEELQAQIADRLGPIDTEVLSRVILEFFQLGVADPLAQASPFTSAIADRPTASLIAREMIAKSDTVTSLRHRSAQIGDQFGRWLISRLDGSRTVADLAYQLASCAQAPPGEAINFEKELTEARRHIEDGLKTVAKMGILLSPSF